MHALALGAEEAEDLDGSGAGAPEPVRHAGVELGRLPGVHDQIVMGEHEAQAPAEDVEPLVASVGSRFRGDYRGRDGEFERLQAAGLPGERHHDRLAAPAWLGLDAWVADRRGADEVVERDLVGSGNGKQQLQAGTTETRLEAGERTDGDAGGARQRGQRRAALLTEPLQPRSDPGQDLVEGSWCVHALIIAKTANQFVEPRAFPYGQGWGDTVDDRTYDVVIVGGGAAGLSAALVLARARRRVVVVDAGSPRNAPAAHLHGFLSRDGMPPGELLAAGRAEVGGYGGEIVSGTVRGVEPLAVSFAITRDDGRALRARRLLVATGLVDEFPAIPGVRERWGRDVLHCPYCHGYEVRDEPVGVLARVPTSVYQTLLVRQWSPDVVFFRHTLAELADQDRERLAARDVTIVEGTVERLVVEGDRLTGVELADGSVVARSALFVAPRFVANDAVLTALGAETVSTVVGSFVATDPTGRTSVPGVWAAGNVADPAAFVIGAAGAGARAAGALNADLVEEDVALAIARRGTSATQTTVRTVAV